MSEKQSENVKLLDKRQATKIYQVLSQHIQPKPELQFRSALDLLVAVVLSAQCTDKAVNAATEKLWKHVRTAQDYLALGQKKLEEAIHSIGLYRNKAKSVLGLCEKLVAEHGGEVPSTREELMALPGVGRKTANVVLNLWFKQPVIAVDTHIFRVAHRLRLSDKPTPEEVELDLMQVTPKKYLLDAHHYLLLHGRYTCQARTPQCGRCPLSKLCQCEERKRVLP
ncbi:MAG: endonuclease III [Victivallales bacterium]|nr:endonuclease III [Victivallales bacterium]